MVAARPDLAVTQRLPALMLPESTPLVLALEDGREWEFHTAFAIGRAADNDIILHDPLVSRHHAAVEPSNGGWLVRDLSSVNGTFLDDLRVTDRGPLEPPAVLRIGGRSLSLKLVRRGR
jgi:predicted component of type VI protein secretion system